MELSWQNFEDLVASRLLRKYWGFESVVPQELRGYSRPDFVVKGFWFIRKIVVNAKHDGQISHDDIDKLVRDGIIHRATWRHLYISPDTGLPDEVASYAKRYRVEIYRLGWNESERKIV